MPRAAVPRFFQIVKTVLCFHTTTKTRLLALFARARVRSRTLFLSRSLSHVCTMQFHKSYMCDDLITLRANGLCEAHENPVLLLSQTQHNWWKCKSMPFFSLIYFWFGKYSCFS